MTTSDPIAAAARAAAARLTGDYGSGLASDVEAVLAAGETTPSRPDQYFDPVSLASLIVSVASLAWMIYAELRPKTPKPSHEVVARQVRVRLCERHGYLPPDAERIAEIVVNEIIQTEPITGDEDL